MKLRPIALLGSVATAVAVFAGPVASANAYFTGYEEGYGATQADAIHSATVMMNGDYVGCHKPYYVESSGQYSDGSWWADLEGFGCTGIR